MSRPLHPLLAALAAIALAGACSSAGQQPKPVASLAMTSKAQTQLQAIVDDWARSSRSERMAMKARISAYTKEFSAEPPALMAEALLAWVTMDEGFFAQAEAQATAVQARAAAGTTNDLGRTIQGAVMRRRGRAEESLRTLSPLVSKLIDGWARALLNEEIVQSALAAKEWQTALHLMAVWLREASPEERDGVKNRIAINLATMPAPELLLMLDRARGIEIALLAEEEREMRKLVAQQLATFAREKRDVELAQHLLKGSGPLLGDQGDAIARLATGVTKARVEARTVGLLLSLRTDETRRRGAEVTDGIAYGLGLPGPWAGSGATGREREARLVSRDDHGAVDRIDDALAALSADGAAILIAGVDADEAAAAARFAEQNQIPVLLLRPAGKAEMPPTGRFTFLLGDDPAAVENALAAALIARGATPVAIVAEDPHRHGALPPEVTAVRACSEATSPWKPLGVGAIVLGAACAREAIAAAASTRIVFGAALELGDTVLPTGSLIAEAGIFPIDPAHVASAIAPWVKDHAGPPSWWAGLGHDAAVLARAGVQALPERGTEDPREVSERRSLAAQALAAAQADLWTTAARGFGGTRVLPRSVVIR
ncbi:MAG: hypothetical protein ABJE95_19910 [Byssovorax sp.]